MMGWPTTPKAEKRSRKGGRPPAFLQQKKKRKKKKGPILLLLHAFGAVDALIYFSLNVVVVVASFFAAIFFLFFFLFLFFSLRPQGTMHPRRRIGGKRKTKQGSGAESGKEKEMSNFNPEKIKRRIEVTALLVSIPRL